MKVIKKDKISNGIEIQLEDWREHNTEQFPNLYGFTIGAYPIAQKTGRFGWIRAGEKFRLSIANNQYQGYTNEQVKADYNALVNGEKKLEDLADYFYGGEKAKYYLGMQSEYSY